jgi:hypothetical protein
VLAGRAEFDHIELPADTALAGSRTTKPKQKLLYPGGTIHSIHDSN